MIYLTKTEEQILIFLEKNKSITTTQCAKIFYNHMKDFKNSYLYSYKRLKKLNSLNLINYYKSKTTKEHIYYIHKRVSAHDNMPINVYANIVYMGGEVLEFNLNERLMNGKVIADAFIIYKLNDKIKGAFIEINIGHISNIERYENLFESKECEEKYGGFPNIITVGIIDSKQDSKNFTVLNFDFQLTDFKEKLLSL